MSDATDKFVNHYDNLQVRPTADSEVISAAAKALLKKHSPETDPDAAKIILAARDVLTDIARRAEFDGQLRKQQHGNCIGPYRLVKKIAEGGFGRIYEAVHTILDEKVCIKHNIKITDFDTQILRKEARSIWNLRHEALPAIKDFITLEDGSCAIVMTYIDGITLFDLIEKKGALDPETVCWITTRLLDALRYCHFHGVVHGDVKPQNVMIQEDQHTCTLVDFGLSSIKPTHVSHSDGYTPLFASPEALQEKPLLPESDLYSLGLTMIFALGGDVKAKKVPGSVPVELRDFISDLIIYDVTKRPHWSKVNLLETLRQIRLKCFGREHTNLKKI